MDRAMRAGLDDVGIGALFGLADYRYGTWTPRRTRPGCGRPWPGAPPWCGERGMGAGWVGGGWTGVVAGRPFARSA
jgi:hypothetical protein